MPKGYFNGAEVSRNGAPLWLKDRKNRGHNKMEGSAGRTDGGGEGEGGGERGTAIHDTTGLPSQ